MTSGIYKIENTVNGKCYVGSSKDISKRGSTHFRLLRANKHWNMKLQRSFNKHGEVFKLVVLEEAPYEKQLILEAENKWIVCLNSKVNGYNIADASFGDIISNHPNREEIIKRIASAIRARYNNMSKEDRIKAYGKPGAKNPMFGRAIAPHVLSAMLRGTQDFIKTHGHGPTKGYKASGLTKAKISEVASLRIGTKNPFFGKSHSPETKQAISAKNLGRPCKTLHPIVVDGVTYQRLKDAEHATGIKSTSLWHRARSKNPKFSNIYFEDSPK